MGKALKISPQNLITNWGAVEDWTAGDAVAPTGWVLAGTAGSVAKEATTFKFGLYSMKITSGGTNSYKAGVSLTTFADYQGRTVTFGMYVLCATASKARLYIDDGVSAGNSSYHSGGGTWEWITVTLHVDSSATELTFGCEVQNNAIVAYFDGGIAAEGETVLTELADYLQTWSPAVKFNIPKFVIARRSGVYIPSVKHGERTISISGSVAGSDYAAARTSFDAMLQALSVGKKDLYLYDDRFIQAFLTGENHKYIAAMRMIDFSLKFTAPTPYYSYIARLRDQQTISSSPTSFNFSYGGTVESLPIITFAASGNNITSLTLENLTTGQSMSFTDQIDDGDSLIIDSDLATVENNAVDSIDAFTGDFIKLVPGTNYLKYTGSNAIVRIDYFKRWL